MERMSLKRTSRKRCASICIWPASLAGAPVPSSATSCDDAYVKCQGTRDLTPETRAPNLVPRSQSCNSPAITLRRCRAMESKAEIAQVQRPRFSSLHHISLPCRDVEESKRFYIQVLGGELFHDIPGFAEVRIADIIFGMSQQSGGWTRPTVEYPHYGLNVDGKNFGLVRRWLEACGVPQHGWTRNYKTALLYFRDPSGNLLEIYCDSGQVLQSNKQPDT